MRNGASRLSRVRSAGFRFRSQWFLVTAYGLALSSYSSAADPLPKFERIVVDDNFPGGYQVEVADVNGDRKPDIVAIGGSTCAWYENPGWKKRIITTKAQTPGIISSATADLDGDGKSEIAIAYEFAMSEPTKGKLLLASQGKGPDDPWTITPITEFGSIHRLRWACNPRRPRWLVVAGIFGEAAKPPTETRDPAKLTVFPIPMPDKLRIASSWMPLVVAERPVMHAVEVLNLEGQTVGPPVILTADNLGVAMVGQDSRHPSNAWQVKSLVSGAPGDAPKRGCSEIHLGRLADGRRFLATIDPWHGTEVAVCLSEPRAKTTSSERPGLDVLRFGPRAVIDKTLADGHALWVADVDGDGNDEIFAGHRGKDHRVSAYKLNGTAWDRTVLDSSVAAQDLRGEDIDGDGVPDVVAIGGSTHNVIWYKPIAKAPR
jgi:hypothetical protein